MTYMTNTASETLNLSEAMDVAGVFTLDLVLRLTDNGATLAEAVARVAAESGQSAEFVRGMAARGFTVVRERAQEVAQ